MGAQSKEPREGAGIAMAQRGPLRTLASGFARGTRTFFNAIGSMIAPLEEPKISCKLSKEDIERMLESKNPLHVVRALERIPDSVKEGLLELGSAVKLAMEFATGHADPDIRHSAAKALIKIADSDHIMECLMESTYPDTRNEMLRWHKENAPQKLVRIARTCKFAATRREACRMLAELERFENLRTVMQSSEDEGTAVFARSCIPIEERMPAIGRKR